MDRPRTVPIIPYWQAVAVSPERRSHRDDLDPAPRSARQLRARRPGLAASDEPTARESAEIGEISPGAVEQIAAVESGRDVYERLRRIVAAHRFEATQRVPFLCECDDPTCREIVMVSLIDYDLVSEHPRRFLLAAGHVDARAATDDPRGRERLRDHRAGRPRRGEATRLGQCSGCPGADTADRLAETVLGGDALWKYARSGELSIAYQVDGEEAGGSRLRAALHQSDHCLDSPVFDTCLDPAASCPSDSSTKKNGCFGRPPIPRRHWKRRWMTFASSWTRSARSRRRFSEPQRRPVYVIAWTYPERTTARMLSAREDRLSWAGDEHRACYFRAATTPARDIAGQTRREQYPSLGTRNRSYQPLDFPSDGVSATQLVSRVHADRYRRSLTEDAARSGADAPAFRRVSRPASRASPAARRDGGKQSSGAGRRHPGPPAPLPWKGRTYHRLSGIRSCLRSSAS